MGVEHPWQLHSDFEQRSGSFYDSSPHVKDLSSLDKHKPISLSPGAPSLDVLTVPPSQLHLQTAGPGTRSAI